MSKEKLAYVCDSCGASFPKWSGKCNDCGQWNSLTEIVIKNTKHLSTSVGGYSGKTQAQVYDLNEIKSSSVQYRTTTFTEVDRVLGGGLVDGAVVLLGGDPGIGKSTLLLQVLAGLSKGAKVLYVTGEESLNQVKLRADRLEVATASIRMLAETNIETILNFVDKENPDVLVMDSIQTCYTDTVSSAPGTVSQIRECSAGLVRIAKQRDLTCFLVGHITKDGQLAGPRVLEHMVDTVLYFEGNTDSRFRMLRAIKNRFGAVNELGILAMGETGLKEVKNPSAIFLSSLSKEQGAGRIVTATWEGNRPILVELQALLDESSAANPRRLTVGVDQNRLALILAVLSRHACVLAYRQDVFINVVGGIKITETAIDLPLALAVYSSLEGINLPSSLLSFGEVGLSGEIRPVQCGQPRIKEAKKMGFKFAIIPKGNLPKESFEGINVLAVDNINEAIVALKQVASLNVK